MNNKKYFISAGGVAIVGVVAGLFYYFSPGTIKNLFTGTPEVDMMVSDVSISTSTDMEIDTSTDDVAYEQPAVAQKKSQPSSGDKISPTALIAKTPPSEQPDKNEKNISSSLSIAPLPSAEDASPEIVPTTACPLPDAFSPLSRKIIFNEIAWMGSVSSSDAEWMEIKNDSPDDIDLNGWELMNASGKIKIVFSSGDAISAGGILLLSRNDSSTGKFYSGTLANAGDTLAIVDPQCDASDFLSASSGWPAGNNNTKQTLERDADGIGWHTSASPGGTPGMENSLIVTPPPIIKSTSVPAPLSSSVPPPASTTSSSPTMDASLEPTSAPIQSSTASASTMNSSSILIATVQISGASSTNDLIKLYNPTASSIDMSGWKLHKRSQTGTDYSLKQFPTASVLAAGQTFIWANAANGFSETVIANVSSTETLSADNSIALLDASGTVVDALAWGSGTGQYGQGSPFPDNPVGGQVLARKSINGTLADTSDNTNDFILQ